VSKIAMRAPWLAAVVLIAGCASAPLRDADVAALARADALVLEGCYDCLLEARDIYARVGVGRARPLVIVRLFETDILLGLRETELAIDAAGAFERAAALLPELPPELDGARVLRDVGAVLPDPAGVARGRMAALKRDPGHADLDVNAELTWLEASALSPAVRWYVGASIDCSYDVRARRPGEARARRGKPALPDGAPPLLQYRAAICFNLLAAPLERLFESSPRFIEIGYFIARAKLFSAARSGAPGARALLAELYARFPASRGVTFLNGNYRQLVGDCREALGFYDETLALEPTHEDSMLGRAICLSHLARHEDAIRAASTLVEWNTHHVADAHYWRAWNHHKLEDLETARADIERAKGVALTGPIFTLAGIIEHDQDDLGPAERDLSGARRLSYGVQNCTAAWYLGLVHMKQERWLDSSSAFEDAMTCYESAVAEAEAGLRDMQARTNVDPDFKASQIAGFEAAIREDRRQYHAAAFNTANQSAHGGHSVRAKKFLEIAAKDPALADLVRQLREILRRD
jgi:tetratricopeptide (TPR) repeat protein